MLLEEIVADDELAEMTGFAVGSSLTHIMRARRADGMRISTDESFYLSEEVPGLTLDIISDSVYAYLEGELGMKIGTSKRTITVEAATESDYKYIDLGEFNAVGVMRSHTFDADGVMIEYTVSRQRPGFFAYSRDALRRQRVAFGRFRRISGGCTFVFPSKVRESPFWGRGIRRSETVSPLPGR